MKVISTVHNLSKRYTSKNIAHYCSTKPSYSLFIYESESLRGLQQFQLYRIETTGLLHYAQSRILHNWRYISNRARQTSCYLAYKPLIRSYIYVLSKCATSDDIEWPSRSRTYTASFKMFFCTVLKQVTFQHCKCRILYDHYLATSYLLLLGIPSPTHSFIPGLKPSFYANPSHRSPSFFLFRIHYINSPDCVLLLLSISVFTF